MTSSGAQHERRRRILETTVALARAGGFEAVQMRAVAEGAGVALGTLYRYFPSKIHLLVAALGRQLEEYDASTAGHSVSGASPRQRVVCVLDGITQEFQKCPELTEAMVRAYVFADASVAHEIEEVGARLTRVLARALAGSPDRAQPTTEDEAAIVAVISDVWLSALARWVGGRTGAADVGRSVDVTMRLLLR